LLFEKFRDKLVENTNNIFSSIEKRCKDNDKANEFKMNQVKKHLDEIEFTKENLISENNHYMNVKALNENDIKILKDNMKLLDEENKNLQKLVNHDRDNHKILETLKSEMKMESDPSKLRDYKQERLKIMWIMNNKYKVKLGKQKDLAGLIASLIVDIQREKEESVKVQKELKDRERRAQQYEGELKEFNT